MVFTWRDLQTFVLQCLYLGDFLLALSSPLALFEFLARFVFLQMPHESTVEHSEAPCEHMDPPPLYHWESFVVEEDENETKNPIAFDLDDEDDGDSSESDELKRNNAVGEGNGS